MQTWWVSFLSHQEQNYSVIPVAKKMENTYCGIQKKHVWDNSSSSLVVVRLTTFEGLCPTVRSRFGCPSVGSPSTFVAIKMFETDCDDCETRTCNWQYLSLTRTHTLSFMIKHFKDSSEHKLLRMRAREVYVASFASGGRIVLLRPVRAPPRPGPAPSFCVPFQPLHEVVHSHTFSSF